MGSRTGFLLCLVLLLCSAFLQIRPSFAASAPDLGLGFGPANVQPVADGIPIYSSGDNVWLESYYNTTVIAQLLNPGGETATSLVTLDPGQLVEIYTFLPSDPAGQWTLSILSTLGSSEVPLTLAANDYNLTPSYQGSNVTANRLGQFFSLPASDAYNVQACSAGNSTGPTATFEVAGGKNGTVKVSLGQNVSQVTLSRSSASVAVWLELYSEYTYSVAPGVTASESLLVAKSPVQSIAPPATGEAFPLVPQMPLRYGRFDLRLFERTTSGLTVQEGEFLRMYDGSWISMAGCTSLVSVFSSTFSLTTDLDSSNSTWPRHLFTMYTHDGLDSYSVVSVPGNETAIHLRDYPDNKPLTGVVISASGLGLRAGEWDSYNSAVYLLAPRYPSTVTVELSFSGVTEERFNVSVPGPYQAQSVSVRAGTLEASATTQGKPVSNATFTLGVTGSQPATLEPGPLGSFSILLPPGNYALSASYGGVSANALAQVTEGTVSTVNLDLSMPSAPAVLYLLVAVGLAAAAFDVFIWRLYIKRRGAYD